MAQNTPLDTEPAGLQLPEAELADPNKLLTHIAIADRIESIQRIKELKDNVTRLRARNIDLQTANGELQTANGILTERIAGFKTHRFASSLLFTVGGIILGLWPSIPNGQLSFLLGAAGIALIGGAAYMNWKHL